MDERTVTVDLPGLRAVADVVEGSANALSGIRFLSVVSLPGSAVGGIASPTSMTARFGGVVRGLLEWAAAARASAEGFENVEQHNAGRVDRA